MAAILGSAILALTLLRLGMQLVRQDADWIGLDANSVALRQFERQLAQKLILLAILAVPVVTSAAWLASNYVAPRIPPPNWLSISASVLYTYTILIVSQLAWNCLRIAITLRDTDILPLRLQPVITDEGSRVTADDSWTL